MKMRRWRVSWRRSSCWRWYKTFSGSAGTEDKMNGWVKRWWSLQEGIALCAFREEFGRWGVVNSIWAISCPETPSQAALRLAYVLWAIGNPWLTGDNLSKVPHRWQCDWIIDHTLIILNFKQSDTVLNKKQEMLNKWHGKVLQPQGQERDGRGSAFVRNA